MRLDVVLPAHDEQDRLGPVLDAYTKAIRDPEARFVVAMDGCTDATGAVVAARQRQDPRVVALDLPRLGKGGALAEAFRRSDADIVGFVDADGATPPAEFLRLVRVCHHADGAIASRRLPASVLPGERRLGRRAASAGFATVIRGLFQLPYRDTQCGAKAFRRDALSDALPHVSAHGFLFDVDLLHVLLCRGHDIVEVPTVWIDREGSKLALGRDARRMGLAALALWLQRAATPIPTASGGPVVARARRPSRPARQHGAARASA